jgi:eukaryotic-like serine/threonine-protein kinase
MAPPPPARSAGWRNAFWALIAVLVLAAAAGVVARERSDAGRSGPAASASPVRVPVTISSLDPSGGSGFRRESGSTWRTQTYQSERFGNLKSGVGLLLDLGSPRAVGTVTFEVVGGPIAVELRAGDGRAASAEGYTKVASNDSASGSTRLAPKDGGKHRYWLVWVTRLAGQDGGYRAVVREPVVTASAS